MQSLADLLGEHWAIDVGREVVLQEANGRRITRVETTDGAFVAKELPVNADVADGLSVLQALNGQGFTHAPELIATTQGKSHFPGDRVIYVMAAVDGVVPGADPMTQRELGRIARLLNGRPAVQHRRTQQVTAVIADLLQRDDGLRLGAPYRRLVGGLEVLVGEPMALVHGEINAANAKLTADGTIVLLDWEEAGMGVRWLDAGYPLIQTYLAEDLSFDAAGASAFYGGYGRDFRNGERDLVFAAATLHALRYLPWGDTEARWRRVLFAVEHKEELLAAAGL